jgi:hypothetical protein
LDFATFDLLYHPFVHSVYSAVEAHDHHDDTILVEALRALAYDYGPHKRGDIIRDTISPRLWPILKEHERNASTTLLRAVTSTFRNFARSEGVLKMLKEGRPNTPGDAPALPFFIFIFFIE